MSSLPPTLIATIDAILHTYIDVFSTFRLVSIHETNDELPDNDHCRLVPLDVALDSQSLVIGGKDIGCILELLKLLALGIHPPLGCNLSHYNVCT